MIRQCNRQADRGRGGGALRPGMSRTVVSFGGKNRRYHADDFTLCHMRGAERQNCGVFKLFLHEGREEREGPNENLFPLLLRVLCELCVKIRNRESEERGIGRNSGGLQGFQWNWG
jgi:hypothetical protein